MSLKVQLNGKPLIQNANGELPDGYVKLQGKNIMVKKTDLEAYQAYKANKSTNGTVKAEKKQEAQKVEVSNARPFTQPHKPPSNPNSKRKLVGAMVGGVAVKIGGVVGAKYVSDAIFGKSFCALLLIHLNL